MKKNILYFFFDELRTDALQCYGNPAGNMHTPNIDNIAAHGTRFTNCFCNSPVCVPSRMSLMTGLYPEDTGVYGNEASLPPFELEKEYDTIPKVFARHGYKTASFGKTHLPWKMKVFQTNNSEGSEMDLGLGRDISKIPKISAKGQIRQNLGSIFPENRKYSPEKITENAISWLEDNGDSPFFLRVSFLQPHTPVLVKQEYAHIYSDLNFSSDLKYVKNPDKYEKAFSEFLAMDTLSHDEIVQMKQLYYGLAAWVDSQVGLIINFLEKKGLMKNTIIVVNSDHGCNLGECGTYAKFLFSPHSQKVPLIISHPDMKPSVNHRLCSNIDLAATLFSLTDLPKPEQFKGKNLFDTAWNDNEPVYATIGFGEDCSYPLQYDAIGRYNADEAWPRRACIRTEAYRLDMNIRINGVTVKKEDEDIFFTDSLLYPEEDVNLAGDKRYESVICLLRKKLLEHCAHSLESPKDILHQIEQILISRDFFNYLEAAQTSVSEK